MLRETPPAGPSLIEWLKRERVYCTSKFGEDQSAKLLATSLNDNQNFGGQTSMYLSRRQNFDQPGAELLNAQATAKAASSALYLWATIRSLDRVSDIPAIRDAIGIADIHLAETDYHGSIRDLDRYDVGDTSPVLGLRYLESNIGRQRFARKFRLGQLMRTERVMLEVVDMAALQFERTLEATGALPAPGISSGNIELWLPDIPHQTSS